MREEMGKLCTQTAEILSWHVGALSFIWFMHFSEVKCFIVCLCSLSAMAPRLRDMWQGQTAIHDRTMESSHIPKPL